MKVIVLYRPNSEHSTRTEAFIKEFQRGDPARKVELVDVDSREGVAKVEVYGVVSYPAAIAMSDDGKPLQIWQGEAFPPLLNDLAYYATS